jgi:hypothetical protein|tara:strand:- start:1407 stop:2069 length:663 start_codon:yes stop_codon:yes gene_type:complete
MVAVDELMVVLDADPTGLEEGMGRAAQSTDDFTQAQQAASLATMEQLARQEAMVGSLNQVIGGYGKMGGAAQKLGIINEEQFQQFEKSRAALELMVGPMEIFIALKKMQTAMTASSTAATTAGSAATKGATASTWGFNAALLANPIVLIVVAVILLIGALYVLEKRFGLVTMAVGALVFPFKLWLDTLQSVIGAVEDLVSKMDVLGDVGDRVSGFVGSIT